MNAPMILYYLFKLMFLFFKIFSSASFSRLLDKLKLISVYTIYKIQSEILYLIHYADFLSIKCLQEFVMCLFSLEMNVQIDKRTLTPKRQHSFNHWRFTQNSREKGSLHTTKLFHIKFLLLFTNLRLKWNAFDVNCFYSGKNKVNIFPTWLK